MMKILLGVTAAGRRSMKVWLPPSRAQMVRESAGSSRTSWIIRPKGAAPDFSRIALLQRPVVQGCGEVGEVCVRPRPGQLSPDGDGFLDRGEGFLLPPQVGQAGAEITEPAGALGAAVGGFVREPLKNGDGGLSEGDRTAGNRGGDTFQRLSGDHLRPRRYRQSARQASGWSRRRPQARERPDAPGPSPARGPAAAPRQGGGARPAPVPSALSWRRVHPAR